MIADNEFSNHRKLSENDWVSLAFMFLANGPLIVINYKKGSMPTDLELDYTTYSAVWQRTTSGSSIQASSVP